MHVNNDFAAAPSPGWGPRGQGPSKNRKGPSKNIRNDHVPPGLPDRNFGILGIFGIKKSKKDQMPTLYVFHGGWSRRLSHTHSYPACHAPDLVVAFVVAY